MEINNMCPICILTMVINWILWALGLLGLAKFVEWCKKKYYLWSGKKCSKCRDIEKQEKQWQ